VQGFQASQAPTARRVMPVATGWQAELEGARVAGTNKVQAHTAERDV
jgi:hypothetical protein